MIFVDSSVLVDVLRGRKTPAGERFVLLERDQVPFVIPAVCYQEVLQGARDQREWDDLRGNLDTQRVVVPEDPLEAHRTAARIYMECRRAGVSVRRQTACYIAAQVIAAEGTLLHDDGDFTRIAKVTDLQVVVD
jgi:predicted nucleic acid-binding protein